MPPLKRRDTPAGPRYFLDDVPLETKDVVEVWSPSGECVHRGFFCWTGYDHDEPFVWNDGFGCRVSPESDFRRYVPAMPQYVQPPLRASEAVNDC